MMRIAYCIITALVVVVMQGCSSKAYTPVSDLSHGSQYRGSRGAEKSSKPAIYKVVKGDTLFGIAWRFDLDYRKLAAANQISSPYLLSIGQKLRLSEYSSRKSVQKTTVSRKKKTLAPNKLKKTGKAKQRALSSNNSKYSVANNNDKGWLWPVKNSSSGNGKIIRVFSSKSPVSKGLDIRAPIGSHIVSSRSGKVIYAGSRLKGYGKLIIVKHDENFLSAYAHNKALYVKEGQWIKQGQKIAELGSTGTQQAKLHFEIRRQGKPVNPLIYVKKR